MKDLIMKYAATIFEWFINSQLIPWIFGTIVLAVCSLLLWGLKIAFDAARAKMKKDWQISMFGFLEHRILHNCQTTVNDLIAEYKRDGITKEELYIELKQLQDQLFMDANDFIKEAPKWIRMALGDNKYLKPILESYLTRYKAGGIIASPRRAVLETASKSPEQKPISKLS